MCFVPWGGAREGRGGRGEEGRSALPGEQGPGLSPWETSKPSAQVPLLLPGDRQLLPKDYTSHQLLPWEQSSGEI